MRRLATAIGARIARLLARPVIRTGTRRKRLCRIGERKCVAKCYFVTVDLSPKGLPLLITVKRHQRRHPGDAHPFPKAPVGCLPPPGPAGTVRSRRRISLFRTAMSKIMLMWVLSVPVSQRFDDISLEFRASSIVEAPLYSSLRGA